MPAELAGKVEDMIAAADKVAGTIWTYMTGEAAKVVPFPQRANAVQS